MCTCWAFFLPFLLGKYCLQRLTLIFPAHTDTVKWLHLLMCGRNKALGSRSSLLPLFPPELKGWEANIKALYRKCVWKHSAVGIPVGFCIILSEIREQEIREPARAPLQIMAHGFQPCTAQHTQGEIRINLRSGMMILTPLLSPRLEKVDKMKV